MPGRRALIRTVDDLDRDRNIWPVLKPAEIVDMIVWELEHHASNEHICKWCGGIGILPDGTTCPYCDGDGKVKGRR